MERAAVRRVRECGGRAGGKPTGSDSRLAGQRGVADDSRKALGAGVTRPLLVRVVRLRAGRWTFAPTACANPLPAQNPGVAPVGLHFHEELEKNFRVQQLLDLQSRGGADLLQRGSLLADQDRLLALALAEDRRGDAGQPCALLVLLDQDGGRSRELPVRWSAAPARESVRPPGSARAGR